MLILLVCYMKVMVLVVSSLSRVQLFCNPMNCSPPGSSVHGISQARIYPRKFSLKDRVVSHSLLQGISPTQGLNISCIAGRFFTAEPSWKCRWGLSRGLNKGIGSSGCEVWCMDTEPEGDAGWWGCGGSWLPFLPGSWLLAHCLHGTSDPTGMSIACLLVCPFTAFLLGSVSSVCCFWVTLGSVGIAPSGWSTSPAPSLPAPPWLPWAGVFQALCPSSPALLPLPKPVGAESQRWFAVAPRPGRLGEGWAANRYRCSLQGVWRRGGDEGGWQEWGFIGDGASPGPGAGDQLPCSCRARKQCRTASERPWRSALTDPVTWKLFSRVQLFVIPWRVCSLPVSSVHEIILQARILEWVASLFSTDFSHPGIEPTSPTGGFFTSWATREARRQISNVS